MNEWYTCWCRKLLREGRRYLSHREKLFLAAKLSRMKPLSWAEMKYINAMTRRLSRSVREHPFPSPPPSPLVPFATPVPPILSPPTQPQ